MVAFTASGPQPTTHVRLLRSATRTAPSYPRLAGRARRVREGRGRSRGEAARRSCRRLPALGVGARGAHAAHAVRHSRLLSESEVRGAQLARGLLAEVAGAA